MVSVKTFFVSISSSFFQLSPKSPPPPPPSSPVTTDIEAQPPPPPPPPSPTTTDLEMQPPPPQPSPTTTDLEMRSLPPPPPPVTQLQQQSLSTSINLEPQLRNMIFVKKGIEWQNIIMAFCFTSAVEIALRSAATQPQVDLPLSIDLLSIAITFIFSSLFISKFIASKFPTAASVLEKAAIFLAVTAFFFTISISMSAIFKCAAGVIYLISLLIIAICNCL